MCRRRAAEASGRRRWWILVPALPLLVVCLGGTHAAGANQATARTPYAYLLAAFAALTLLLRRRAPLVGMSAAALATAAYLLLDQPYGPILFVGAGLGLVPDRGAAAAAGGAVAGRLPGARGRRGRAPRTSRGTAGAAC